MLTIETIVTISEDGSLTAKAPPDLSPGPRRAVIVLDETGDAAPQRTCLPNLSEFREGLGVTPCAGSYVVDMRAEERS